MIAATEQQVADFGNQLVERIISDLNLKAMSGYGHLDVIRNLAGQDTGFVRAYNGSRIAKLTYLSINIMPGARYFNIVLVPDAQFDVPRFANEGMVSSHGSQVSTDLYHDTDQALNIAAIVDKTKGLTEVFNTAKKSDIAFVPSRQVHMRALCSPHFLNVFGATGEQLPVISDYANQYYDEWKKIFVAADKPDVASAADRQKRRKSMSDMVIAQDPDRNMVVQVYGEETVSAIEQAVMY